MSYFPLSLKAQANRDGAIVNDLKTNLSFEDSFAGISLRMDLVLVRIIFLYGDDSFLFIEFATTQ